MSKSLKMNNDNYIDSTGIVHNRELLSQILNNRKEIKMFNTALMNINVSAENYKFSVFGTTYSADIDLSQYDWFPDNVIAILTSQGYQSNNGDIRCIVLPHVDYPTSKLTIFAPIAANYNIRVLILYKE